jgi:hypothetical protein
MLLDGASVVDVRRTFNFSRNILDKLVDLQMMSTIVQGKEGQGKLPKGTTVQLF